MTHIPLKRELKPCPFCGETGLDFDEGSTFRWLLPSCKGCGATCGEVRVQTMGEGTPGEWRAAAEADAIDAWNRRSALYQPDTEQAEAVAEKERAQFEAAAVSFGWPATAPAAYWRSVEQDYSSPMLSSGWAFWKARAALALSPAAGGLTADELWASNEVMAVNARLALQMPDLLALSNAIQSALLAKIGGGK